MYDVVAYTMKLKGDRIFAYIIRDEARKVIEYTTYLVDSSKNHNSVIATNCNSDKFMLIRAMITGKKGNILLFHEQYETHKEVDEKVNEKYTLLRKADGLDCDWFNGEML